MISYSHDLKLVAASIVVSMVAAFTGLALTNNISGLPESRRKALVVMSSFVLGGGIWSMHFVAMLAHQFEIPIYYDLLQTLSSALVAILVVGVALLLLHFSARTPRILVLAGLILGLGILSMHFIGMLGVRGAVPVFSVWAKWASCLVAAVMGVAAISVAYGRRSKQNIIGGALLMGFSVVIVHYTAMHGTKFLQSDDFVPASAVLASSTLAVIVTMASFIICGAFLLAATTFLTAQPAIIQSQPVAALPAEDSAVANGSPPAPQQKPAESIDIPFERDKKIGYVQSADVAAIRADGHYSHLYTRDGVRFCPWAITEAENRLAASGFHRTHRSYLVNISAVVEFERRKETGICVFENFPQLSSVPVSRNRVIGLLEVLDPAQDEPVKKMPIKTKG